VLLNRSVLDLVELIQLSLEHVEVTALLGIQVDGHFLELFESINYLVELRLA